MQFLEIIFNAFSLLVFIIYWALTFVIIYHLTRFGVGTQPKRFAAVFMLGSLVLSTIAIVLFTKLEISVFLAQVKL